MCCMGQKRTHSTCKEMTRLGPKTGSNASSVCNHYTPARDLNSSPHEFHWLLSSANLPWPLAFQTLVHKIPQNKLIVLLNSVFSPAFLYLTVLFLHTNIQYSFGSFFSINKWTSKMFWLICLIRFLLSSFKF